MVAIGIDLGTTNSCVAYVKNNQPVVIPLSENGKNTLPSIVSIIEGNIECGEKAKRHMMRHPENVIIGIKHLIGRTFDDKHVQEKISQMTYNIITREGKTGVTVENKTYAPEQICAFLLKDMKNKVERLLNQKVTRAVITVPTHFNDAQRQATKDAGKIAGFENIHLLDEPTAAAIAYGISNEYKDGRRILVFDFGGGTLDVSIIQLDNGKYETIGIDGDITLGGDTINKKIKDYFLHLITSKGGDVTKPRDMVRLLQLVENAKIGLSESSTVDVDLFQLIENDDEPFIFTKEKFDEINKDIFEKALLPVENCLKQKELSKENIDDILLIGGSTRITTIGEKLEEFFGKPLKKNINPDEAVAMGASIFSNKLEGDSFEDLEIALLSAYSFGLQVKDGKMSVVIPKFTSIPAKINKKYNTVPKGNSVARFSIFSGESEFVNENRLLGSFMVKGVTNGPEGTVITSTFEIDTNGILKVSAVDSNGKSEHLNITLDKGSLTQTEIEEFSEEIEEKMK